MPSPHQIVLKNGYYLDHFQEMLGTIRNQYEHSLEPCHFEFLQDFETLPREAQLLYVRIANRKGYIFAKDCLNYEEITDLDRAATILSRAGFIRSPEVDDFPDLLSILRREDLISRIRQEISLEDCKALRLSTKRKSELVECAAQRLKFETSAAQTHLVQDRVDELDYLLFLYFGKLSKGMTPFALRDLGVLKTQQFKTTFEARFESRKTALDSFFYARRLQQIEKDSDTSIIQLGTKITQCPITDDPEVIPLRHRAIYRLGRRLERAKENELALEVYRHSDQFPSSERHARLLLQRGNRTECANLLSEMIDSPSCDEELFFAEDFYQRKFQQKKVGRLTNLLRNAPIYRLDETGRGHSESSVIAKLARKGIPAFHTENVIWTELFGLFFWDQLYNDDSAAIHNEFERYPQDLSRGTFYPKRKSIIEERLQRFDTPDAVIAELTETWNKHADHPNGLVNGCKDLFGLVLDLVRLAPQGSLVAILREMAKDFRLLRRGFPDLMLIDGKTIRFVEVKAEGDKIQRHQLTQLERLSKAGFSVEVVRVEWAFDPQQEYVVVDVETTGGKAAWHRITEIGAVKVIGDKIVDQWTTLINPGRRIPKNIVQLTGISDEMVATAPAFEQVADEFRAFIGDAVFVAHRASFDYGFISEEYRRLEQDFLCPTLCTVVTSRKYFPGLKSYGLANLCREFNISLDSHHRALCDAKATAKILIKINQLRQESATA